MDRLRADGLSGWYLPQAKIVHVLPAEKCGLDYIAKKVEAQGVFVGYLNTGVDPKHYPFFGDDFNVLVGGEDDPALPRGHELRGPLPGGIFLSTAATGNAALD